jgi:hypothetical protein
LPAVLNHTTATPLSSALVTIQSQTAEAQSCGWLAAALSRMLASVAGGYCSTTTQQQQQQQPVLVQDRVQLTVRPDTC